MAYPFPLPDDIDITFKNAYPDGDSLYFSTKQLARDLVRAGYDDSHISFIMTAIITYEREYREEQIKTKIKMEKDAARYVTHLVKKNAKLQNVKPNFDIENIH